MCSRVPDSLVGVIGQTSDIYRILQCARSTIVMVEGLWRDRDNKTKVSYRSILGIYLDLGGQAHFCMHKLQGEMKKKF